MRAVLMIAGVATTLLTTSASKAQTSTNPIPYYPWCALEVSSREGGERRSCGFTSYAQCMESVRGQTGICFENIWAVTPPRVVRSDEGAPRKR